MSADMPLVSIIMPAYNAEESIARSIESAQAQTMGRFELIVLDDGSSDHTCEIVEQMAARDLRIRLYRSPENVGVAAIRNKGIELSSGAYIALLDSDDVWDHRKLEMQLGAMERHQAEFCYTSYALVDNQMERIRGDYVVPESVSYSELLKENFVGCSTVLSKAELLKNRGFRTDFYHEDYVLWLELLKDGCTMVGCPEVLTFWRYQRGSRSYGKMKSLTNRWDIYRNAMHLPLWKSLYYLSCYAVAGLKKYNR